MNAKFDKERELKSKQDIGAVMGSIYNCWMLAGLGGLFTELTDQSNILGTEPTEEEPEPSTLIATFHKTKKEVFLRLIRWFGDGNPKTSQTDIKLPDYANFYSLKQIQTRYLAASLQEEVQIFDLCTLTKIGSLNTSGFFSLFVRVNPHGMPFMLNDLFV